MPLIDDGFNQYTMENGKMVPLVPEHESLGVNGQTLLDYDKKTATLKLNPTTLPNGALETLIKAVDAKNGKGVEIKLCIPPFGDKTFPGVKRVEALSPEEMKYEEPQAPSFGPQEYAEPTEPEERGFIRRIRDTISYYTGW